MNASIKKSILLFLLLLLLISTGFSQRIYSKQNLEKASMEELNAYLKVSKKKKQTGTIMSVAGSVTFLAGLYVFSAAWEKDWDDDINPEYSTAADIGGFITLAGFISSVVGVPMLIAGSTRVKRITEIMDAKKVSFELAPFRFRNLLSQHTPTGITLRLNF